jgi:hypothetical protein
VSDAHRGASQTRFLPFQAQNDFQYDIVKKREYEIELLPTHRRGGNRAIKRILSAPA